ncbi:MAG: aspartate/glutamate racemase family protein [Rhodobacteraceae bacterium]|nr:aspartate/glutamate racemase family protein [Paracoccaceae bacterium]
MALPYSLISSNRSLIGLVVLQSDESIEADMRRLLPLSVELFVTRVPSGTAVTVEGLVDMERVLTQAASLFPVDIHFRVVGYGCTSGTAQIGQTRIADLICAGTKTDAVTEPVSALVAACKALRITRLGLISPYVAAVSQQLRFVLTEQGITVTAFKSFEEPEECKVARISPDSIATAAINLAQTGDCDAVFLSCTNLRTLDIIEDVEQATGLPILSSNQVLAWHLLGNAGGQTPLFAPGQLWKAKS